MEASRNRQYLTSRPRACVDDPGGGLLKAEVKHIRANLGFSGRKNLAFTGDRRSWALVGEWTQIPARQWSAAMALRSLIDMVDQQHWLDPVADVIQRAVSDSYGVLDTPGRTAANFLHGTWLGHPL